RSMASKRVFNLRNRQDIEEINKILLCEEEQEQFEENIGTSESGNAEIGGGDSNIAQGSDIIAEQKEPLLVPAKRFFKKVNYKKLLRKRLPCLQWLPEYTVAKCLQDILAGFSVGLTEVPQGIAYAVVAGLEPQYGLYSAFLGCFMYTLFGSCKDVNIGPTAIMAMMLQQHVQKFGPDGAILLSFLTGIIVTALGILNLGFVVQFFSFPVIAGFTSAAAVQIASTQLTSLLGIRQKGNEFLEAMETVFNHLDDVTLWDSVLGCICIIILLLMKQLSRFGSMKTNPDWSPRRNMLGRVYWILSLARNALVVVIGSIMAYIFEINGQEPFILTGNITSGLPDLRVPVFDITYNNETYTFGEVISSFGASTAFLPMICILEAVAIAKAFSKGKQVDATQEMLVVGISNFLGSFVSSMPVTGSFTRSAVNNASGVQTQFGGSITGTLVLLALALLTSTFYYIPKTVLAAVIICAMINLFEYEAIPLLWKTKKLDLIPFFVTLFACIFIGLEYGILIGIASNIAFILYSSLRPPIAIDKEKLPEGEIFVVTPKRGLQFPAAEYIKERILKDCNCPKSTVVVDGKYINCIDATVGRNFKSLVTDLSLRDQVVIFWNFKPSVKSVCTGIDQKMHQYFRDGNLDDIIDNPALNRYNSDVYTIQ
ncbi:hypothetical protein AMK59_819, partial [Oryctes borbonicus]